MAPGPPPSLSHCSAANEVGTTRLVIGRTRVRIPPVPLLGDRSSAVEHHVSTPLVAALAVEAQKAGHLTGNEEMEGAIPSDGSPCGGGSIEEHEVASLGIRVRFPAAAPVECSRDYIGNASKEARRFEPSRERKLSKSLRPLSTSIDSSECRRSYFPEKERLRHLLSLRFPAVNAMGTT